MRKIRGVVPAAVAISFGLLVLAGYLFGVKADGSLSFLGEVQILILNLAVILVGFAVLVGLSNLLIVHGKKIRRKEKGYPYSAILIVSLVITFLLGLLSHFLPFADSLFTGLFNSVQLPIETSLMAVLVVTLTYAAIRLLHRRLNLLSVVFLVTGLLMLAGTAPWPLIGDVPFFSDILRPFISRFPAAAGARGILIGVALGTLTTGLRILFGTDRPYGSRHG
jgi:hypothetical protein